MQLGKQQFLLEEVVADNDDTSGWTGFTSFDKLAEKARTLKLGRMEPLTLEFDSLTTFNRRIREIECMAPILHCCHYPNMSSLA